MQREKPLERSRTIPAKQTKQRSKSEDVPNSKVSQSNSLRSQLLLNKPPCDSHQFLMQPLSQNFQQYIGQKIHFHYTHEMKESRPFPIFFNDFKGIEYLPTFGNEVQIQNFVKNKAKYRTSFMQQKSKAGVNEILKKDLMTPIPKHKYCQVCKQQFQSYQKHITEPNHLRYLRNSYGQDFIVELMEDYEYAKNDENFSEEINFLKKMNSSLKDISILFEKQLSNYHKQMKAFLKNEGF